jgi:hypothetical protein
MSDTRRLIDFAYEENGSEFRDALYSAIHDKVTAHIDAKRAEIAQSLITQQEEEVEYEYGDEDEELEESGSPFDKDYKSQVPTKPGEKAGFTSKKVSTGTVYSRKPPKDEPTKDSK